MSSDPTPVTKPPVLRLLPGEREQFERQALEQFRRFDRRTPEGRAARLAWSDP
ncbi:MAG: hypothetical protein ABTD50_23330 [Polyangiaceae bacterium]|jgi:hypothetical protein